MNQQELLLRDIHLPDPVSWWPPAPGWWLIAVAITALTALILWWRHRSERLKNSPATIARRELAKLRDNWNEHRDNRQLLREVSIWLRRTGMSLSTRREAASLTGHRWQQYLDNLAGEAIFSNADARLINEVSYQPTPETGNAAMTAREAPHADGTNDIDGNQLLQKCERWLGAAAQRTTSK
jgi:hypothetical protein